MTMPNLPPSWVEALEGELGQKYMADLAALLAAEAAAGVPVCPPPAQFFAALERTPLDGVKAVILGQDPYHGAGQAHGLCFSVPRGVRPPPSLRNVFKELRSDLGIPVPAHGCLEVWADRGVLLLNSVLSVRQGKAGSHAGAGWERFTDAAVRAVAERRPHAAFVLWGGYAQRKGAFLDRQRHLVVASAHPSPMAANRGGFFGSRPFSQVNAFLASKGIAPVDWRIA